MDVTIYLKPDGDGFEVLKNEHEPIVGTAIAGNVGRSRKIMTLEEANEIHPVLSQIIQANNPETVIHALKCLREIARQDKTVITSYFFKESQQVNNYDNYIFEGMKGEKVQFAILHNHASYIGHNDVKGAAHRETLSSMINFVEKKPPIDKHYKPH